MLITITGLVIVLTLVLSTLLSVHALISIWQMIYGWSTEGSVLKREMPKRTKRPKTLFSIIVPAYKEEEVIADTLKQILKTKYPPKLFEILVPLRSTDKATIREVEKVIREKKVKNLKKIVFKDGVKSKPKHLNEAYKKVKGDYVVIFDAEDEVHPNLLSKIDSAIQKEGRKIIQTGVSLMNWKSNWFCIHSVLEYYFWFQSRLHWFAEKGVITLGGVGVFFPKEIINEVGGWDERALTEDAKIGIQCSANGVDFKVLSDENFSTKEETPPKVKSFIKQRTRWILGFLQIFKSGIWEELKPIQQFYFLSLVLFPIFQVALYLWAIPSIIHFKNAPILIALASYFPLFLLSFQIAVQITGLAQMIYVRAGLKYIPQAVIIYLATFIPYQALISISAVRASLKFLMKDYSWEKTAHLNLHRVKGARVNLAGGFNSFLYSLKSWIF